MAYFRSVIDHLQHYFGFIASIKLSHFSNVFAFVSQKSNKCALQLTAGVNVEIVPFRYRFFHNIFFYFFGLNI